jgi:hypothetical protein
MTLTASSASPRQIEFINSLRHERGMDSLAPMTAATLTGGRTGTASGMITALQNMPRPERARGLHPPVELTPGVYEVDGVAYVVKPNRRGDGMYAKRIRELNSTRVTEAGTFVAVEFEYEPGAIRRIRPEHRMPFERARELTIRYGRCIVCGRTLRAGESVEQGIGPVCVRSFPELVTQRREIQQRARAEARGAGSLTAMAEALEFAADALTTPADEAESADEHPIDADAARARQIIKDALACYEMEADLPAADTAFVLRTFDRLAGEEGQQ